MIYRGNVGLLAGWDHQPFLALRRGDIAAGLPLNKMIATGWPRG